MSENTEPSLIKRLRMPYHYINNEASNRSHEVVLVGLLCCEAADKIQALETQASDLTQANKELEERNGDLVDTLDRLTREDQS